MTDNLKNVVEAYQHYKYVLKHYRFITTIYNSPLPKKANRHGVRKKRLWADKAIQAQTKLTNASNRLNAAVRKLNIQDKLVFERMLSPELVDHSLPAL